MPEDQTFSDKRPTYIAPFEVVIHNQPTDCWVSLLGKVLNITPLISEYADQECVVPLLAFAGKDISDWFDERDGDIRHYIHPVAGVRVPYCPHGKIPHVEVQVPATRWRPQIYKPWWKDEKYQIGLLTKRIRPIRIVNTFIAKTIHLNICCEDTIERIMERYSIFNSDASSYNCRMFDKELDMKKTLEENGVVDERDRFSECGLSPTFYTPGILLYYKDDFKWVLDDSDPEEY